MCSVQCSADLIAGFYRTDRGNGVPGEREGKGTDRCAFTNIFLISSHVLISFYCAMLCIARTICCRKVCVCQPTATSFNPVAAVRGSGVFRSISHLLRHFLFSALA